MESASFRKEVTAEITGFQHRITHKVKSIAGVFSQSLQDALTKQETRFDHRFEEMKSLLQGVGGGRPQRDWRGRLSLKGWKTDGQSLGHWSLQIFTLGSLHADGAQILTAPAPASRPCTCSSALQRRVVAVHQVALQAQHAHGGVAPHAELSHLLSADAEAPPSSPAETSLGKGVRHLLQVPHPRLDAVC